MITVGNDRAQLAAMSANAREALGAEALEVVADRGYFDSEEILACDRAGITVTLPKPQVSGATVTGRFGKRDFRYVADGDVYICPAGNRLTYRDTREEGGLMLRRHWTNLCGRCSLKSQCTTAEQRRVSRWEHEEVLEAVQRRLDAAAAARRSSAPSAPSRPASAPHIS